MSKQQNEFYDAYWKQRGERVGDRCGYAPNFRRWAKTRLDGIPRENVFLEIGCGDCQFTPDFRAFTDNVIGVDISELQISKNRSKYPDIRFEVQDLSEPLKFEDNSVDVIWCSEVLEHLMNPTYAVQEMHRVLKTGGKLLITVPYHGVFKDVLIALFKWEEHFHPTQPHIRFFTRKTLADMVRKVGFVDVKTTTCGMRKPIRDLLIPTNILLWASK